MKDEKGITLAALIIIVVVLFVLLSVTIETGTESIEDTRLRGFYSELEIIQKRADQIAANNENYIENGNTIYIKELGTSYNNLTDIQKNFLNNIVQEKDLNVTVTNFKYFTADQIKELFELSEIKYDVFIDFDTRTVIAEDGININGQNYYALENNVYIVEKNETKNIGEIESLNYTVTEYGENSCKVTITPSNIIGDVSGIGSIKYKKTTTKYWETSNNNVIIIEESVNYNIIYIDSNSNSLEKIIKVEVDNNGNLNVLEITE